MSEPEKNQYKELSLQWSALSAPTGRLFIVCVTANLLAFGGPNFNGMTPTEDMPQ